MALYLKARPFLGESLSRRLVVSLLPRVVVGLLEWEQGPHGVLAVGGVRAKATECAGVAVCVRCVCCLRECVSGFLLFDP